MYFGIILNGDFKNVIKKVVDFDILKLMSNLNMEMAP